VPLSIVANAPGSAMLFGEHAVLRGGYAVVAAIDCRLSVKLTPRDDDIVEVQSSLGTTTTTIHTLSFGHRFRFVEGAFRLFKGRLPSGTSVSITSGIDPSVGLASSASVTVALIAALKTWIEGSYDCQYLLHDCCAVIRSVQGHGSGADAASIIYGGVVGYQAQEAIVTPLVATLPLVLVYSGKKTPTPEVIRLVNAQEQQSPVMYKAIFSAINEVTIEALAALQTTDYPKIGLLMNQACGLMEALGVGTKELSSICWSLRETPSIFGAKISGSGLGDAAIGLGTTPGTHIGRQLPSTVASKGVEVTTWKE
jgi:mevalonate kinase